MAQYEGIQSDGHAADEVISFGRVHMCSMDALLLLWVGYFAPIITYDDSVVSEDAPVTSYRVGTEDIQSLQVHPLSDLMMWEEIMLVASFPTIRFEECCALFDGSMVRQIDGLV